MPRHDRPPFDITKLQTLGPEQQTRLLFDWWCDDDDREFFLDEPQRDLFFRSRSQVQDDPSPPRVPPPQQGHALVALVTQPAVVASALANSSDYSNIPYAELGGASFMLALDPGGSGATQWHQEQRQAATAALGAFSGTQLEAAAQCATDQAAIVSLAAPLFDLAEFAEQAALRYFGLVFGYGTSDHLLLEDAARKGYRALQYLIVGRHFVSEGATLPNAQQALARLAARTDALVDEYASLLRAPRKPMQPGKRRPADDWPVGVQPWSELGLSSLGQPVLRDLPRHAGKLSGQDLCNLVGGLLVGMVGNVQTAVCLMVQQLFADQDVERVRKLKRTQLLPEVRRLLALRPPVPFLPRRTLKAVKVGGVDVAAGIDCILALRPSQDHGCPWGEGRNPQGIHACLGRAFVEPLLVAVLHRVLALPDLDQRLDALTSELLKPQRLWGFGCTSYPLRYRRDKQRVQQPLIVVMPVKPPLAENVERLRRIVRGAAPRIESVLRKSGMVHVAWFEFMEGDTQLALRTVYDGDFDAYILHFAENAGELFDQLFECIEGASPMPVAEHPYEFVETIRRFNRAPLGRYFYSAYPRLKVPEILACEESGKTA
jgi:cytochrome P450